MFNLYGFGGQSTINNIMGLTNLSQPTNSISASAATSDPSALYANYMNIGLYGNLLGS